MVGALGRRRRRRDRRGAPRPADRFAGSLLLPRVAGHEPARRAVGDVDEARAVDTGRGQAAPLVRRSPGTRAPQRSGRTRTAPDSSPVALLERVRMHPARGSRTPSPPAPNRPGPPRRQGLACEGPESPARHRRAAPPATGATATAHLTRRCSSRHRRLRLHLRPVVLGDRVPGRVARARRKHHVLPCDPLELAAELRAAQPASARCARRS